MNNEKWSSGFAQRRPTQQTNVLFFTSIHCESGKNCTLNKQNIQYNHSNALRAFQMDWNSARVHQKNFHEYHNL
jgi:hypothetical protein